jgi:hypothetical protein
MQIDVNFNIRSFLTDGSDILPLLRLILKKVNQMSAEFNDLIATVTELETVQDSVVALLEGLHAKLDEALANNDIPAIKELNAKLKGDIQKLTDAAVANTEADPNVGV